MSCRRRDRANDLTCNIGQLAIHGCTMGCCSCEPELYPYKERMAVSTELTVAFQRSTYIDESFLPSSSLPSSSKLPLRRCVQYEPWSDSLALVSMERHQDYAWMPLSKHVQQDQSYSYAAGMTNAAYRPKLVCFDCRKTFKPTVCEGKRVVHTAQPDNYGILETTDGQLYLAPRRYRSPRTEGQAADTSLTYVRHPSSDPREQTVWAVHDPPTSAQTHRWRTHGASFYSHWDYKSGTGRKLRSEYQRNLLNKVGELYEPSQSRSQPVYPPGCTTAEETDAWLSRARAFLSGNMMPPRVVVTCCPSCGKVGTRIGSNFRAPAYKDIKAWKEAKRRTEEEGEHWTFCLSKEEVGWMAELIDLAKARYAMERTPTDGRKTVPRVPGKDRRREEELRAKLGLKKSKINLEALEDGLKDELLGRRVVNRI